MVKDIRDTLIIKAPKNAKITGTKDAVKLVRAIANQNQEYGITIGLKQDMSVTSAHIVAIGGSKSACCDIRNILRGAVVDDAYGIIFVHNHPNGMVKPSKTDKKLIKELMKAGTALDIEVVDSIIVSGKKWKSMFEKE